MDEKKPWWKKVLAAIAGFFAALLTFVLYGTINGKSKDRDNGSGANGVRNNINKADAANRDAGKRVEELKDTAESLGSRNEDIKSSTQHCLDIIGNIRKRNEKK